jgi:hypothetical protein
MSRPKTIMLALLAVCACNVMLDATASAAKPEWLIEAMPLAKPEPAVTSGPLTLVKTGGLRGNLKVECSFRFVGTIGPSKVDATSKVEGAKNESPVNCLTVEGKTGCATLTLALVTGLNLPWHTELQEVMTVWRDLTTEGGSGEPGYEVKCGTITLSCTGKTSNHVVNLAVGVEGVFDAKSEELFCSDGGKVLLEGSVITRSEAGTVRVG